MRPDFGSNVLVKLWRKKLVTLQLWGSSGFDWFVSWKEMSWRWSPKILASKLLDWLVSNPSQTISKTMFFFGGSFTFRAFLKIVLIIPALSSRFLGVASNGWNLNLGIHVNVRSSLYTITKIYFEIAFAKLDTKYDLFRISEKMYHCQIQNRKF